MSKQGLKVDTTKTKVMVSSRQKVKVIIVDCSNVQLKHADKFEYLGMTLIENGGSEEAVRVHWCDP